MENDGNVSIDVSPDENFYEPWEFESCSEAGYLLGDPFYLSPETYTLFPPITGLAFVLNQQSVLKVSSSLDVIEMLYLDELTKDTTRVANMDAEKIVFSLNGDTLYVVARTNATSATLKAWHISSGIFKAEKSDFDVHTLVENNLVAVRDGVLLQTSRSTLELWNSELSECIRSWTGLGYITEVIPISEERVACEVKSKVIIVDTTREGIVSAISIHGDFVACNSKCQVITTDYGQFQMHYGDVVLWKISLPIEDPLIRCKRFSPTEQYCVLAVGHKVTTYTCHDVALYVLDVVAGKTLHLLWSYSYWFGSNLDCKFVGDEECVANLTFTAELPGNWLRLFNVKSGDLLSEIATEGPVTCLASYPREGLLAIGFDDSRVNFKVLHVKLPRDKDDRKSKKFRIKPKD